MIKVKKLLSFFAIIFLTLNSVAFAESEFSSSFRDSHEFENQGKIEESDRDTVQSATGQEFAGKFSDGKMSRREMFSYESGGIGQFQYEYDIGPSYAGYSKEHMVFGEIFKYIGSDLSPVEIKNYCSDPKKIADILLKKLKDKAGNVERMCNKIGENEAKCTEFMQMGCSRIGTAVMGEGTNEIDKETSSAYMCPVNRETIIKACVRRNTANIGNQLQHITESCEKFNVGGDRLIKECEVSRQRNVCDKEKFFSQCIGSSGNTGGQISKRFNSVSWACYDGLSRSQSGNCQSSEALSELARKECEGHCYPDRSKCGVNTFTVYGECGASTPPEVQHKPCPLYPVPQCPQNQALVTKTDSNGCTYYHCETTNTCPTDARQCPDGSYVNRVLPNCEFAPCRNVTSECPVSTVITCTAGTVLERRTDSHGCLYYYCKPTSTCPEVSKPTCGSGETLQASSDSTGCIISYQCVRQQVVCTEQQRPTCSEGQSLKTTTDSNGCNYYFCETSTTPTVTTNNTQTLTSVTGSSITDDLRQRCNSLWEEQQKMCSTASVCNRESFIEKCKEQSKKNYEGFTSNIGKNCEIEIKFAEQRCERVGEDRKHCLEESAKRCEQMKGMSQRCKEFLTEEKLKEFILEEVKKRCKFTNIVETEEGINKAEKVEVILAVLNTATKEDLDKLGLFVEDLHDQIKLQDTTVYKGVIDPRRFGDIKLLPFVVNAKISTVESSERAEEVKTQLVAGQRAEEAASRLVSLRDSDVPEKYLYLIEDKASDVLNVSENLNDLEKKEREKGIGYRFRLFLGLAKQAEQEEIRQLLENKEKLGNSIEVLTKLSDEVPNDVAKAVLKEQVENLKKQKEDIEVLIETKEKRSKGLFGIFG